MPPKANKSLAMLLASALSLFLTGTAESASDGEPVKVTTPVKLITLGTGGGPAIRLKRAQSANALVVGDAIYLIDAGDGVLRQLAAAGLHVKAVRAVFLTHHHLDHTAGLFPLLGRRWMNTVTTPLLLYGPAGTRAIADGFRTAVQPAVDVDFASSPHPLAAIDVREIGVPGLVFEDSNIRVFVAGNTHYHAPLADVSKAPKSYAYRIETSQGAIVFTGDTGPSAAVTKLADGADLLVSEVIDLQATLRAVERLAPDLSAQRRESLVKHLAEDHLVPEQVGELAAAAAVKQVVLSHLAPGLDDETSTEPYAAGVKKLYRGPVTVAEDLMVFPLQRSTSDPQRSRRERGR